LSQYKQFNPITKETHGGTNQHDEGKVGGNQPVSVEESE
jgi:hypothetical protein